MDSSDIETSSWPSRVAVLLAALCLFGGLISFSGWAADMQDLTDWDGSGISIQPNTAAAAVLTGLAILLLQFDFRRIAAAIGIFVGVTGAASLFQIAAEIDLGINILLMFGREWGRGATLAPGQMGPPSAVSWTLLGTSLAIAGLVAPRKAGEAKSNSRISAAVLAILVLAVSSVSIAGYIFKAESLYIIPRYTAIAFQTALFIFAASLAILLSINEVGPLRMLSSGGPAGVMVRRLIPIAVVVPLLLGIMMATGQGERLFDYPFGIAVRTVLEIGVFLTLLWWTARAVDRQSAIADERDREARELDQRLAGVLGSINDGFTTVDKDWRYTFVNDVSLERLGKPREQVIGQDSWAMFPDAVGGEAFKKLHRAMEERVAVEYEVYYEPWGKWLSGKAYPTPDGGLAIYSSDVTGRKRAEEMVRRSEQELQTLADAMPQVVWIAGSDGKVNYYNRRVKSFGGIRQDGKHSFDWQPGIHPDDHESTLTAWRSAEETRTTYSHEHRIQMADGSYRWHLSRAVPVKGDNPDALRWYGTATDVHDRKLAEVETLRARKYAEATLRTSPVPLLVLGSDLRVVTANEAFYLSFEVDAERIEGMLVYEFGNRQWDIPELRGLLEDVLPQESSFEGFEVTHVFENIGRRTMLLDARQMVVENGGPTQIVLVINDITERKRIEDNLAAAAAGDEFRIRMVDALRPLSDPIEVQAAACGLLGRRLAVGRAFYCEVDDEAYIIGGQFSEGIAPLPPGRYPIGSFGEPVIADYRAGRTVVMTDAQTDPRLPEDVRASWAGVQCRGVVGVPLVKKDKLVAVFGIHSAEPRAWKSEEIALIEETADRTWAAAERARSEETIRQSAETLSTLVERSPFGVYVVDSDFRIAQMNQGSQDGAFANVRPVIGRPFEEAIHILWPEPVAAELFGIFRHTLETGEPYRSKDFYNPRGDIERVESYEWELHRIATADGRFGVVCYYYDSTELRRAEEALRRSHEELQRRVDELGRFNHAAVGRELRMIELKKEINELHERAGSDGTRYPLAFGNGDKSGG